MLEGRWIKGFQQGRRPSSLLSELVFKTEQSCRHNGCTGILSLRDLVLSVRLPLAMIPRRLCVTRRLGL
jgi:hypothetical protein